VEATTRHLSQQEQIHILANDHVHCTTDYYRLLSTNKYLSAV